jgi:glycosyltransferase involved in cell wall biosynthesis
MKLALFANTDWYLYNFRLSLVVALREAGHEVVLISPPGPYGTKLLGMGFRWVAAPMERRSLNPLAELRLIWWLRRLFVSEQVHLVHSFTIKSAVYGALAAKLAGVPSRVNAVAGMGYVFSSNDRQARLLRPWVRRLVRITLGGPQSRLILQNPDDVNVFKRQRLVRAKLIRLIPSSGVDCDRFSPNAPAGKQLADEAWKQRIAGFRRGKGSDSDGYQPLRVLLPARMLWDKGVGEFVEAARMLRAEGRRVELLLAGDPDPGNPGAVPVSHLNQWEAEDLVNWLGHVDDMPALLRAVDVVALPSYREGLPRGLIEAGACGRPLITTDAPGCREVVQHGVNGLLIPVRDPLALADAIRKLEDEPVKREEMGRAARVKVLAEFDERIVIERTIAVYRELLPDFTPASSNKNCGAQCG